jgi:peptide subunit release factor RF-3
LARKAYAHRAGIKITRCSASAIKARGARRRVRSDWMAVERERGISVSSGGDEL